MYNKKSDQRVQAWAKENNLRLNASKYKEMTFQSPRARARKSQQLPPLCLDIERVQMMTVLGVVINDRLSASDHVTYLITSCARLVRVTRTEGARATTTVVDGRLPGNGPLMMPPLGLASALRGTE